MPTIQKLYPGGKAKVFSVTYDDGVLQDVRFVALLNRYGLKGTFNLNSHLMEQGFTWAHESGMPVTRLSSARAAQLYDGHEVASHTLTHPYLHGLNEDQLLYELQTDKDNLQRLFGQEIRGFAVPFDYYSPLIEACAHRCGFAYVRTPEEWLSFTPPPDRYNWKAGIFHLREDLAEHMEAFLDSTDELALCQIVGHSYDLDAENKWPLMEHLFQKVSAATDVLPITTIELITYLTAMDKAQITQNAIINDSDQSLWFAIDGQPREVKAHTALTW